MFTFLRWFFISGVTGVIALVFLDTAEGKRLFVQAGSYLQQRTGSDVLGPLTSSAPEESTNAPHAQNLSLPSLELPAPLPMPQTRTVRNVISSRPSSPRRCFTGS
jgi:hypothetical protein